MNLNEESHVAHLAHECFGDKRNPAVVLIQGIGTQMIAWPDGFCRSLQDSGYYVLRFDNRDCGLSEHLSHLGRPSIIKMICMGLFEDVVYQSYGLKDMAQDVIELMNELGIEDAHIVGASMGGMVAQWIGILFPHRVKSLCLLMSSSGHKDLPGPTLKVRLALMRRAGHSKNAEQRRLTKIFRTLEGKGYVYGREELDEFVGLTVSRGTDVDAFLRQLQAIVSDKSRVHKLSKLSMPVLVVHGREDPMLPLEHAIDLQHRIPNSRLKIIDGLGHVFPRRYMAELAHDLCDYFKSTS